MLKKILLFTVLALSLMACTNTKRANNSQADGIKFEETDKWQIILDKAKAQHKPIFLDIYATWCGPCKMLKAKTFTDSIVGDYFNKNFINAAFDGELGDGINLSSSLQLEGYPTLYFMNPDGSLIKTSVGYINASELLNLGKQIAKAFKK